ncbi:MAG: sulfatase-like hydrolase/transferase [Pirellulaceae bacterium]
MAADRASGDQEQPRRPNIVMIISDDQAWTDYGFMGHEHVRTPRLDRLAAESLTFTRGYVPTALCRPSLASMINGRWPHEHGIVGNDVMPIPGMANRRDDAYQEKCRELIDRIDRYPSLPHLLRPLGYASYQCGKWWEGSAERGGFDEGMTHGDPARGGRHGDVGLQIGRQGWSRSSTSSTVIRSSPSSFGTLRFCLTNPTRRPIGCSSRISTKASMNGKPSTGRASIVRRDVWSVARSHRRAGIGRRYDRRLCHRQWMDPTHARD